MEGCIDISYSNETNQFIYSYSDETCSLYVDDNMHGTIYSNSGATDVNIIQSFGLYLVNNSTITLNNSKYVFQGSNVNNFVKINNDTWRIISVDEDYNVKLIKNSYYTTSWCNDVLYSCSDLNLLSSKLMNTMLENLTSTISLKDLFNNKLIVSHFSNGVVDYVDNLSTLALSSLENSSALESNIGLLTISEYLSASGDGNYLTDIFGEKNVWLLNQSSSASIWVLKNGELELHVPTPLDITYVAYPVITLDSSTYIESGTGTSLDAYIIK